MQKGKNESQQEAYKIGRKVPANIKQPLAMLG